MNNQEGLHQRLLHLSTRLAATLERSQIEKVTTSLLPEAFTADCCAIIYLGPEREQGRVSTVHPAELLIDTTLSREESLALLPFLAEETSRLVRKGEENSGLERLLDRFNVQSALLCVLRTEEALPPLLWMGLSAEHRPPVSEELLLWESTCQQVASALDNSRRYQEMHRRLRELRLLHEVAMATSTTVDTDQILYQVVDALWNNLSPDTCGFLTVDAATGALRRHPSSRGHSPPNEELLIPPGSGITGWAVQTGQTVLVHDVTRDPRYISGGTEGIRSELCVPIQVGGKIVAALNLESRQPGAFTGEHLRLVSTVASQLAVAIERSQIFRQSQQRVRELTALMRINNTMQRATRLEEILDVIMNEAFSLVGLEHGSVLLLDQQKSVLRIAASRGLPDDLVTELNQFGIPTTFGTFDTVLRTGAMLEIPDTSTDPRVESGYGPIPPQLTNVPLKTDKGIIGILVLDALAPDNASRRLLQAIASMAAMAIERAGLFEETRQRLEEVRFLQEVALAATATLDFDEILRRSVEALQRWLEFEVFGFLVVDKHEGVLHLHPTFVGLPEELHHFSIPIGEGITGWVAQTGKSYLTTDVQNDPHYYNALPEIRSEMCVPVKVGNRVIAVMDLESSQPNAFGPNEIRLLSSMAHQLAVALQNAQLYEREQKQHRLAEAMRQAAVVLGATRDLEGLLDEAFAHLEKLLPLQAAFVVLLRGENVEQARGWGRPLPANEQWLAPGTLGARIYQEHRSIVIPDTRRQATWQPWPGTEDLLSWAGVPFMPEEEIKGMLLIGATEADTYDRESAALALSFASQLALGIERTRFYEQERRRAEQLDLLNQIGQRVVGIMDLNLLQEETIRCLHEALQPHQISLALIEQGYLVVQVWEGHTLAAPERKVPLQDKALICWVVRNGVPVLVPDIIADRRFQSEFLLPDTRTEMAVPLRAKDQLIGVLDVQGNQVGQFDESDLSTLQAVGSQVSGAIERALLYAELRGSVEQLQQTDQLRRDFLSTINHEMRAPLTAILGFTDFLLRKQAGPLTHAQEEYLEDIRAAGERILTLVENILEAARLEEGQVIPRCAPVRLEDAVSRVMAMVQPTAMEKALTLSSRIPQNLPAGWADLMMLERILINLLSNAVKYTPPGGSVWVEARISETQAGMLEISVRDTGVGIDPGNFAMIFQRYRRLETPTVGQVSGTGLGLFIVQGLVKAQGGDIWVESTVGQGSSFTFTLPMFPEEERSDLAGD